MGDSLHEANFLRLDNSKIKAVLSWKPKWDLGQSIERTVELYKTNEAYESINMIMEKQIMDYLDRSI